ncbi:LYR motif-containing protein 4-like [Octopus bimaculoides]|uniref:LYR motif-containing protein 4-like n=1 Tax=Octopus bimaculoides TaxID=37653 RepID=UPI00071D0B3E|nr:LYR motif-containing protein 4-like [Octopus bimaculoides]|eukprot:XP_014785575.1 PREDICTED: LYR motif-containing protein 4-like [Octopus bimaculoides]
MSATRTRVLTLYKKMLRESQKFKTYNFRMYALRRTKDAFRENISEMETSKVEKLIEKAEANLQVMQRQTAINNLFTEGKLVIE